MARIFVGGTTEAQALLREIESWLAPSGHELEAWDSDAFYGGDYPIELVLEKAESFDGALFVFGDASRQNADPEMRDRALAELGIFLGTHGKRRTVVCWEGKRRPNNLVGVTYIDANEARRDAAQRKVERWGAELGSQPRPKVVRHGGDVAEIIKRFPTESYKIKLQRSSFATILDVYLPYDNHMDIIQTDLVQMLELGGSVQVLLCDPDSSACKLREQALQGIVSDVAAEVRRSLAHLDELRAQLPEAARSRFEVRLYSSMPSMSIYRVDDMVLGGNHYHDCAAIDGPQYRVASEGSLLGERLVTEHQRLWDHPSTRKP